MGCIAVTRMELQEPTEVMMVGSCIPPPLPEPKPPQIMSTTFEAEGVCLGPPTAAGVKGPCHEYGMSRGLRQWQRGLADSLLDHAQHLFWALSIPFGLARLLCHLLAMHHAPAPSKTLLAKALSVGQKKYPGGCMLADPGLWHGTSPSTPTMQVKGLWVYAAPPKLDASSWVSTALN